VFRVGGVRRTVALYKEGAAEPDFSPVESENNMGLNMGF
jgi:hypothetical protein